MTRSLCLLPTLALAVLLSLGVASARKDGMGKGGKSCDIELGNLTVSKQDINCKRNGCKLLLECDAVLPEETVDALRTDHVEVDLADVEDGEVAHIYNVDHYKLFANLSEAAFVNCSVWMRQERADYVEASLEDVAEKAANAPEEHGDRGDDGGKRGDQWGQGGSDRWGQAGRGGKDGWGRGRWDKDNSDRWDKEEDEMLEELEPVPANPGSAVTYSAGQGLLNLLFGSWWGRADSDSSEREQQPAETEQERWEEERAANSGSSGRCEVAEERRETRRGIEGVVTEYLCGIMRMTLWRSGTAAEEDAASASSASASSGSYGSSLHSLASAINSAEWSEGDALAARGAAGAEASQAAAPEKPEPEPATRGFLYPPICGGAVIFVVAAAYLHKRRKATAAAAAAAQAPPLAELVVHNGGASQPRPMVPLAAEARAAEKASELYPATQQPVQLPGGEVMLAAQVQTTPRTEERPQTPVEAAQMPGGGALPPAM